MKIRTKICGLTQAEDIQATVQAGADAIGLVFYAPSPRAITVEQAVDLVKVIPPFTQIVGLFVNASKEEIMDICRQIPIDILQFHGDESPEECQNIAQSVGRRWYKALQVRDKIGILQQIQQYQSVGASAILLDAYHPDLKGGTGEAFDWTTFPKVNIPLILAGGLHPDNVKEAIALTQPYAVDVSSGVEYAKGRKDHEKLRKFITHVLEMCN